MGRAFYGAALETLVPVSSTSAAEMVKLLENTFRAVNIGLANEVLLMCETLGLDVWEVIDAAATKPFGFMKFTPGPGIGGHCIPKDPLYLAWKLKTLKYTARFIELADEVELVDARLLGPQGPGRAQRGRQAAQGEQGPRPGRGLQAQHQRHPRVARPRHHPPAAGEGRGVFYHDPFVPTLHYDGLEMASVEALEPALARWTAPSSSRITRTIGMRAWQASDRRHANALRDQARGWSRWLLIAWKRPPFLLACVAEDG